MKNQHVSFLELCRRFMSVTLASVMIFNLTAEASAQAISRSKYKPSISSNDLEKILKNKTAIAQDNTFVYSTAPLEAQVNHINQQIKQKDPVLKQLETLKLFFFPLFSSSSSDNQSVFNDFVKQDSSILKEDSEYVRAYVQSLYDNASMRYESQLADLKAQKLEELEEEDKNTEESSKLIDQELDNKRQAFLNELNQWKRETLAQLAQEERAVRNSSKERFSVYQKKSDQLRDQLVLKKKNELFALYKTNPAKVKSYLIAISTRLLSYRTIEGKSFFTQEEKELLNDIFIQDLAANDGCLNAKSSYTCERAFSVVAGLGMVSKGDFESTMAIMEFVDRHLNVNGIAGPALLAGASALLAMGRPSAVGGILDSAVKKENNPSFPLSFAELYEFTKYNVAGNMRYMGDVSKMAQMGNKEGDASNAWEELALMLAAEGSKESLDILQKYGVGRCTVTQQKDQFFINCDTILPFLVGALISGKSGAEKYAPSTVTTQAGAYFSNRGAGKGVIHISKEEAQKGQAVVAQNRQALKNLSQNTGLPPAAVFLRYLFLNTMGDLSAPEELSLDNKLYRAFAVATKNANVKTGFSIEPYNTKSPIYVLKRSAYDRSKAWSIGANVCDVGLLVWFGADIVRALPKAARWMKLAGNGALASVSKIAGRTRVLGRLKGMGDAKPFMAEMAKLRPNWTRNFNAKAASRLEGILKTQAPLFNSTQFGSDMFRASTQASSALATARLEGGKVVLDKTLVQSSQVAAKVQSNLDKVAANVNNQFMKEVFSLKSRVFGKDALYRQLWVKELYASAPSGATPYALTPNQRAFFELAGKIRGNKAFKVPQALTQQVSLMPNGHVNQAAVLHNLKLAGVSAARATETSQILEKAVQLADQSYMYRDRKWRYFLTAVPFGNDGYHAWRGNSVYRQILGKKVGVLLNESSAFTQAEKLRLTDVLAWNLRSDYSIKVPKAARSLATLPIPKPAVTYETRSTFIIDDLSKDPVALPLKLRMDPRVNGVSDKFYQHVDFIRQPTGEYTLSMINAADMPFKLENFKIIARPKDLPKLAQAVEHSAEPLMLTMSPYTKQNIFTRGWNAGRNWLEQTSWFPKKWRRGTEETEMARLLQDNRLLASRVSLTGDKEERFSSMLQVYRRLDNGTLLPLPMTVKADRFFDMPRIGVDKLVLEGKGFSFLNKSGAAVNIKNPFYFGIPKGEAGHLAVALKTSNITKPISLTVATKKTDLWRMYVATGLSLSSASTGLLSSLEEFYPGDKPYGASDTDKMMITLFLPFIPSFFAPVFTPFVKRWGALRVTEVALALSTAGLAFPIFNGFVWNTPQDKNSNEKPEGLPSYKWLYVSAGAIGMSSALLRASLNTLIGKASGSTGLVKSMLAKNIGSAALLVPPLVFGGLYSDDGTGVASKPPTFASSFPVLGAGSAAALLVMHNSSINRTIGQEKGFKFAKGHVWEILKKESLDAYKLVGHKAMLPMMGGAFFLTGFESAAYNKATNQMLKPAAQSWASANVFNVSFGNLNQPHQKKNLTATFTGGALLIAPFFARWKAGPILNMFGTNEKVRYTKMLQYSLMSSAAGGGLLLSVEKGPDGSMDAANWGKFVLGGTLLGLGTANVFQSLQNLATARYMEAPEVVSAIKAAKGIKEQQMIKDVYKTASRTVFSAANVGMAIPPVVISTAMDYMTDDSKAGGAMILDEQVPAYSLGASYGLLGAGALISLGSLGSINKGAAAGLMRTLSVPVGANYLYKSWKTPLNQTLKLQVPDLGKSGRFNLVAPAPTPAPVSLEETGK